VRVCVYVCMSVCDCVYGWIRLYVSRDIACIRVFCWCVAVCCSVLQCVAVCCSVLQCVAVCCRVLQCDTLCSSVLQCVAVCCSALM